MASGNDIKAAEETYAGFVGVVKWTAITCAIIVAIVVVLIA